MLISKLPTVMFQIVSLVFHKYRLMMTPAKQIQGLLINSYENLCAHASSSQPLQARGVGEFYDDFLHQNKRLRE